VTAEVAGGDGGHKRGFDVGDRHVSSGVILHQLARQPAEAGPEFEIFGEGTSATSPSTIRANLS
jgi:hypothetical protein